jgi:hypothetical protein
VWALSIASAITISLGASAVSFGSSSSTPLTITLAEIPQESNSRLRDGEADARTTLLDSDIRSSVPIYVEVVGESEIYARGSLDLSSLQLVLVAPSLKPLVRSLLQCHLKS